MSDLVVYSFEDMLLDIVQFKVNLFSENTFHKLFFDVLINTGLRFRELRESERALYVGEDYFEWITLKGNNNRFIYFKSLPSLFLDEHLKNSYFFNFISNTTINNVFKRQFPRPDIFHESKSIKCHFFRHFMIKKMVADGYNINEIAAFLGEIDEKNIENYSDSILMIYE